MLTYEIGLDHEPFSGNQCFIASIMLSGSHAESGIASGMAVLLEQSGQHQ